MADIKLDDNESAVWNEVGTRGDAFRKATLDRADEQARVSGRTSEVVDEEGQRVDAVRKPEFEPTDHPEPEPALTPPPPSDPKPA